MTFKAIKLSFRLTFAKIRNSSPPYLITISSFFRVDFKIITATCFNILSPILCHNYHLQV